MQDGFTSNLIRGKFRSSYNISAMYSDLLIWTIYWYLVWFFLNFYLKALGADFHRKTSYTSLYFLLSSLFPIIYFLLGSDFYLLIFIFLTSLAVHLVLFLIWDKKVSSSFIVLNFDICFQQIMVLSLVSVVVGFAHGQNLIMWIVLLFGVSHFPLVFLKKLKHRYLYFAAGIVGAFVFGVVLNHSLTYGIMATFAIHTMFYHVLGLRYHYKLD